MRDKSNCSVIYTLFKIAFLGKWDKRGERPFLWPLTNFPVHSVQYRISSCFEQFCWDLVRTCGFATCCLTDGMSNLWTKWWRLLLPTLLINSFPFLNSQDSTSLSICLQFVQVQTCLDFFLLSSLLLIPCTCLPAVLFILFELSLYKPSALDIGYYAFSFSLFPDCCVSLIKLSISFSFATWRIQLFLSETSFSEIFGGDHILCSLQCCKPAGHPHPP